MLVEMEPRNEPDDVEPWQRLCQTTSIHGYAWVNRVERRPLKLLLLAVVIGFTLILPESATANSSLLYSMENVMILLPIPGIFCHIHRLIRLGRCSQPNSGVEDSCPGAISQHHRVQQEVLFPPKAKK